MWRYIRKQCVSTQKKKGIAKKVKKMEAIYTLITGKVYINLASNMIRFVRIKYNNVREKYMKRDTNNSSQNSQIRWTMQKVQGEKPSKKARFPVYLYFITERMRYFAYLRRTQHIHVHIHACTRTDECITHGPPLSPCLADHPHGYFTAASAVSPVP